jgi:GGDEF domain-containing protein
VQQLNRLVAETCRQVCGADFLSASAGAAWYPEDGDDAEELLARADSRMYDIKRRHHTDLAQLASAVDSFTVPDGRLVQ